MFFAQDGTRDAEDFSSKFSAVDTRLQEKQYNVGHSAIVPPQIPVFINIFYERGCSHFKYGNMRNRPQEYSSVELKIIGMFTLLC